MLKFFQASREILVKAFFVGSVFILCLVLGMSVTSDLVSPQPASAVTWFNNSWNYRRAITVTNSTSTALSDYQVNVTLSSSNFDFSKALSDGSDIRVTQDDGTTLIPYFIESFDQAGASGSVWVKVPSIPANGSATIYVYYGNSSPTTFDLPPVGPFEKLAGPVISATGDGVLPENIVYDDDTSKYWMIVTDRTPSGGTTDQLSLYYSTDMESWTAYASNPILTGTGGLDSPHIMEYQNTWYVYYEQDQVVKVATASSITGPYSVHASNPMLGLGPSGTWEDDRVTEVYVFQRDDGVWMMFYMGDAGGFVETVGYATASSPTGPWTKYAGNPIIDFGSSGTYDAGTVADPFIYKYNDTYYIFYAASSTINPPWVQAYVTTKDFVTFTKQNVVLGEGSQYGFDDDNAHRGALIKVGDYYYMSYAGVGDIAPYLQFQGGMAKMYAKSTATGYPPEQVFGLYEDFSESTLQSQLRTEKPVTGNATTTISNGVLEMRSGTSGSVKPFNRLFSVQEFEPGSLLEARVKYPNATGTSNYAGGIGLGSEDFYPVTSPTWVTGKFGNAFSSAGKMQYVNFGNPTTLRQTSNITVEAWVKVNSYNGQAANYILSKNPGWAMYISSAGALNVLYNGSTVIQGANAFSSSDLGNWVHIAFTYDGSTTKIYKNGNALTTTGTFATSIGTSGIFMVGSRSDAFWFDGVVDEVRISDTVRYTTNFTPDSSAFSADSNTKGLWHFDESSGLSVADSSGNSNTGTMNDMTGFNIHHFNASNWFKSTSNGVGDESQMSQATSTDWLTQRIWLKSSTEAQFQNDNNSWESVTSNIPIGSFRFWAMITSKNDNSSNGTLNLDWVRVREYHGTDPSVTVGSQEAVALTTSSSSTSSSSSSSSDDSKTCTSKAPGSKVPIIYSVIAKSSSSVELSFSSADGEFDHYALAFGTQPNDLKYGATNIGNKDLRQYTVNALSPGTTYYFSIRAGNGCATGGWSDIVSTQTLSGELNSTLKVSIEPAEESDNNNQTTPTPTPTASTITSAVGGYNLAIVVTDTKKQPLAGATVTLHSTPRTTVTNEKGEAFFEGVERGEHTLLVSYEDYRGEQKITLEGDKADLNIAVTVVPNNPFTQPQVLVVLLGAAIIIVVLVGLIVAKNRSLQRAKINKRLINSV